MLAIQRGMTPQAGRQMRVTREKYEYRQIHPAPIPEGEPLVLFVVETPNGQTRDELLSFTTVEARIRLWEEAIQQNPALTWQDVQGFHNYRQFVRALVEGLKSYVV